ncbi:MAG: hypothetical protein LBQ22_03985 [Bacteroidales bacterium]|jgi:hypothetical protein|nr:hypothetical protein [Bacteroidales bacterium]
MSTILITSDNDSDLRIMLELANRLKLKTRKIDLENIEDAALLRAMEEGDKNDLVSREDVMKAIKKQKEKLANER